MDVDEVEHADLYREEDYLHAKGCSEMTPRSHCSASSYHYTTNRSTTEKVVEVVRLWDSKTSFALDRQISTENKGKTQKKLSPNRCTE